MEVWDKLNRAKKQNKGLVLLLTAEDVNEIMDTIYDLKARVRALEMENTLLSLNGYQALGRYTG